MIKRTFHRTHHELVVMDFAKSNHAHGVRPEQKVLHHLALKDVARSQHAVEVRVAELVALDDRYREIVPIYMLVVA